MANNVERGEVEAVEVVGYLLLGGYADQEELEDNDIELNMKLIERMQQDELLKTGDSSQLPLMTVAQHSRLMAGKEAEISRWKEAVDEWQDPAERRAQKLAEALAAQQAAVPSEALQLLITAALYDFGGGLTTRDKRMVVSATDDAGPMAEAVSEFCKMRGLDPSQEVPVLSWQEWLSTPAAPQQGVSIPRVSGIGRDADHPRAVVLYLESEPTDDDLRAIQDALRSSARLNADRSAQGEKP